MRTRACEKRKIEKQPLITNVLDSSYTIIPLTLKSLCHYSVLVRGGESVAWSHRITGNSPHLGGYMYRHGPLTITKHGDFFYLQSPRCYFGYFTSSATLISDMQSAPRPDLVSVFRGPS